MKCRLCGRTLSMTTPCRCLDFQFKSDDVQVGPVMVRCALRIEELQIEVTDMRDGMISFEVTAWVADRDDPKETVSVKFGSKINTASHPAANSKAFVIAAVRRALHQVVQHEVEEHLFVDGVRAFDPHKDERKQ